VELSFNIVNLVLIFLAALSVIVWGITIYKALIFYHAEKQNKQFMAKLQSAKDIRYAMQLTKSTQGSLSRVCAAGTDELFSSFVHDKGYDEKVVDHMVRYALKNQASQEQSQLENGIAVLASIGSTAPFIGLFGTVWGIMNALTNISDTGSAGLDVVAGPIGEALIATAIGIITAVPAVLAYNYFIRRMKKSNAQMERFGDTFHYLVNKSSQRE
jgi:biopolymer transport protein ExbB